MQDTPQPVEPANLKFLRRLVTVLTAVMIIGLVVIVSLFVMRFPTPRAQTLPQLPDRVELPDGATATGFASGEGWFAVVTDTDLILIYDAASGALRQTVTLQ